MDKPKILPLIFFYFFLLLAHASPRCQDGYDFVPFGSPLGACKVIGCESSEDNQSCPGKCLPGYQKEGDGLCFVERCDHSRQTRCKSCEDGFQLKPFKTEDATLNICLPKNCDQYDHDNVHCKVCDVGYQLNSRGRCIPKKCGDIFGPLNQCTKC